MARNKQTLPEVKLYQIDTMIYLTAKNIITKLSMFSEFLHENGVLVADQLNLNRARALERYDKNYKISDIEDLSIDGQANETWLRKSGFLSSTKEKYELSSISQAILNHKITLSDYCFLILSKQWIKVKNLDGKEDYLENTLAVILEEMRSCDSISVDNFIKSIGDVVLVKYKNKYADLSLSNQEAARYLIEPLLLSGIIEESNNKYILSSSKKDLVDDYIKRANSIKRIDQVACDNEEYWNCFRFGFYDIIDDSNKTIYINHYPNLFQVQKNDMIYSFPLQQIFYGAPGTGKSHSIEEKTNGKSKIRTTFHPDSDYSTFVGCYKPFKANESDPITYEFVPQAFVKAYVEAWKKYTEPEPDVFLVIEEINRGNCAQIFGDLFQLLDRDNNGFSKYRIDADSDLQRYLQKAFDSITFEDQFADIKSGEKLCLPKNLHIWATMNTSDQSLFPMDSAFKRRWEWEYVPVNHDDAKRFHIFIGGKSYNWDDFIVAVNKKVFDATQSADKQLGNRFCKSDGLINSGESDEKKQEYMIFSNQFVSKVMFYLWEEVCKDAPEDEQINFMRIKKNLSSTTSEYFTFQELYENKPYNGFILNKEAILQMFMNYLGVAEESSANFKSILAGKSIVDIEKTATGIRPNECNLSDLLGEKTTLDSEMTSVEEDVDATSENNDE